MTTNIYEQIVKEYYEVMGYLTRSNLKGPKNKEIDLLAIKYGSERESYHVIWAEVTGRGKAFEKDEKFNKFSPELERLSIELTGKKPYKIFYVYTLPSESICEEVEKKHKITMMGLEELLKDFIKICRQNVNSGNYPYLPAIPLRSFLQTLIDLGFL